MSRTRTPRPARAAALACCLLVGCGYYSTTGGMVGGIRSVAAPMAANQTAEAGLAEILTERVASTLAQDGRLRVVDEERADAILALTVLGAEDAPFTFTAGETTEQYRFRVSVRAEIVRASDGTVLLELPRLEGWSTYDARAGDAEGRDPAVRAAVDMVIRELVDRAAAGW